MVRRGGRKAGSNAGEMGTPLADLMALLYAKIIDRAVVRPNQWIAHPA
jgi:hypothetical protein